MSPHRPTLPRYQCHKIVSAAKITAIAPAPVSTMLLFGEIQLSREVSQDYIEKHSPEVGGYYVEYDDGYESFSPADAFESGYTTVSDGGGN